MTAAHICSYQKAILAFVTLAACACSDSHREVSQLKNDVVDIRTIQAEHTADLAQVKTELRRLSGKLEELQFSATGKTKELEDTLRAVSSRVPPPPGVPEDLLSQDEEAIGRNSGAAADQFKNALRQLRQGEVENARNSFSEFYTSNPGTAFSDNALFWMGISSEKLAQYDRAIVNYSDVFQKFPAEDRVPAALFRLAGCFEKIGSPKDAVLTYQKLIDEHPRSAFVAEARLRMTQLSPSSSRKGAAVPSSRKR